MPYVSYVSHYRRCAMKFDVHHAGAIGGTPIGAFITSIEAPDQRRARELATDANAGVRIVVLPHRKPNAKLEAALRRIEQKPKRERSAWQRGRGGGR